MRTARTLRLAALLAVTLLPVPARADFTLSSSGVDTPENDPDGRMPLSKAEFNAFEAKATAFGPLVTTDLATATNETLTQASFRNGLSVALSGVKADANSLVTAGVVSTNPNTADGFNVTSGGDQFLRLTPDATNPSVTVATATFTFAHPVNAFGVYVMGLGTAPGTFRALVYDGGSTGYQTSDPILGSPLGGAQYLDIIAPGAGFTRVDFQMTGFTTTSRDIVSFDGISFVNVVPEPSASALLVAGGLALLGSRYLGKAR